MGKSTRNSRGFTLIAALLLTLLLSGLAIGMIYLVSNEQHMGNNDLGTNLSYYAAESGIEDLTSQLSQLYQSSQAPNAASINALTAASNYPTAISGSMITNMNFTEAITWPSTQTNGKPCPNLPNPCSAWDIVGSGPDQGMVASLIPFSLQVTATSQSNAGQISAYSAMAATGASVNLNRTVEVALLPAFEFGIFCDGDCDYFAGPNFNFGGRVHANGNLFLASGSALTFTDKVAAVGQIVTSQLENGWPTSTNYTGKVYVPSAANACPPAPAAGPAANCAALTAGSWSGGFPTSPTCTADCGGTANPGWQGISTNTFHDFIITGATGASKLSLPFVRATNVGAIEIIRRPTPLDTPLVTGSRLYNQAAIRILLADTQAGLHPERPSPAPLDANDVQLVGSVPDVSISGSPSMYYAVANPATSANWVAPTGCTAPATWPLHGEVTAASKCQSVWLRVEYVNSSGNWIGVTQEWLGHGFGRSYDMPPTHPYNASTATVPLCPTATYPSYPAAQCQNPISPAILILQQLQNGLGAGSATGAATTANNWLPINFYDAREGEPRDSRPGGDPETSCSPIGVMNAVELDVGNLWLWLQGVGAYAGGSGPSVSITNQLGTNENGYIVYFSDQRGMVSDTHPLSTFYNGISGMSGLNDTVNSASNTGVPDGVQEPATYYAYSPEDVGEKQNGFVDNWGEANLGAGFGIAAGSMSQPYYISGTTAGIASCSTTAEWNMVTGPRHVLRLVDGGMSTGAVSFLPATSGNPTTQGNGFTVASEEPVYVYGNYNTGPTDPFWPSGATATTPHSAAAIIADSVTLLSNPPSAATVPAANIGWTDHVSFLYPGQAVASGSFPGRQGNTSYYRVAIAAGKSVPFPETAYSASRWQDFGTDGGMHNFLRYLEDRSDNGNGATVNYVGSMITMYYSQYATGVFKCCNSVYSPPGTRNYFFDTQFLNPNNLPPGTPAFQDVVSLSYHQNFTPQ